MAQELEFEWWRPQEADELVAARETVQPESDTGESTLPFWSLMVFTGILLFSPQSYFPSLAPLRPALLVIAIGVLSFLGDRWSRRLPLIEWNRETGLIAGLVTLAAVTVPFALWPGGSFNVLIEFIKTVLVFLLLSQVITTTDRLRRVAWILTCMAVGVGFFTVYNIWTGELIKSIDADRALGNEGSLTKNPNDLALTVNLLLPLAIGLLLSVEKGWQRLLLIGAIGMEMLTVVLSRSRGGAVTLAVIILAYLWKLRGSRERGWIYGLILVAIMAVPFLPSSYFDRLSTIINIQADQTNSAQRRLSDMVTAVKTIAANPIIGAGMGMNVLAMQEARGGYWLQVHNAYLEHAIDLGLPGLAIFLALLMSCIRSVARVRRRLVSMELSALADAIHVSLIAYAVAAMFHPTSYHYYFYYMGGLAIAARTIAEAQTGHTSESSP